MAVQAPPPGRRPPPPPNPDDGSSGRGRPSKLTPALVADAVVMLTNGNYERAVAKALGVTPRTWQRWKELGNTPGYSDGLYGQFRRSVGAAIGMWHVQTVAALTASGDPRVQLAMLERRFPRLWGQYRGELGDLKRLLGAKEKRVAELEALLASLEARLGAGGETAAQEAH